MALHGTGPCPNLSNEQLLVGPGKLSAEVEDLKARGVVFEEYSMPGIKTVNSIATAGGAKTAWFKDSEGNILAISQRISS